jgi:predicted NBD/HSP70 family sugar kinase
LPGFDGPEKNLVNDASLTASSPRRIRQRNEIAVLQALHRFGPLTKADLARELRVNRSSSGHIITALESDGLVREQDGSAPLPAAGRGRAGRPGIRIELVPEALCFVGVEIGVEHMAVVEIDLAANLASTTMEPFDGPAVAVEDAIRQAIALAMRTVPEERLRRCEGFGVATPAQMDRRGIVRSAPLLRWQDVNLAELVKAALPLQVPVVAENDANAFAIGATYRHSEFRSGVTLFLVMESGVGGGIVIDGGLFRGGHGLAGEIGHLLVPDKSKTRALEQVIGLEIVLERYRREAGGKPELKRLLADVSGGMPAAVAVAQDWADTLAYGLVQACRVIYADRIVLGGSLATLYPAMADRVTQGMRVFQEASFPLPVIAVTDLEGSGPAFGAACILHQRYLSMESQRLSDSPDPAEVG